METPKEKVIVGFDGREESTDALALARMLAGIEGAELRVAVVLPHNPLPIEEEVYEQALTRHFDELFAQARERLNGAECVTERLESPSPAEALNGLAEREGARMIVLGSTHRGMLGRVYPGSVGERLLTGAPCAVAVAPRGYAGQERDGGGIVGVGYDGSDESKLALETAAEIARRLDGTVRLVVAAPPVSASVRRMMGMAGGDPLFAELLREETERTLKQGVSSVSGVNVDSRLKLGDPAQALAEEGIDLDLLVVGSRGYGPVRRVLLGGVAAELMRNAPCPVMVIPRSSAAPPIQSVD